MHVCGFNYRFVPAVRRARELIEAGAHRRPRPLPRPLPAVAGAGTPDASVWRFDRAQAGTGAIGDLGAHIIDLGRYLVGEIASVSRLGAHVVPGREVDDAFAATVEFAERRHRHARGVAARARPRQPQHLRAERLARVDRIRPRALRRAPSSSERPGLVPRRAPFTATGGRPGHVLGWGDTFTLEFAHLLRAIAGEGSVAPARRDVRGRLPRRRGVRRDPALGRERTEERIHREPMKTSLGIWALGPMVTRFVPGGYQPERHERADAPRRCAAR